MYLIWKHYINKYFSILITIFLGMYQFKCQERGNSLQNVNNLDTKVTFSLFISAHIV